MRRSSRMLRRPRSSAERSASSAAAGSRCSTWRAPVTWSMTAASPCPTKSCMSRAIRRRSVTSACWASSRRVAASWAISSAWCAPARPSPHGKHDAEDPDADRQLGRILDQARRHRREHGDESERDGRHLRLRPAADHVRDQRHLEQERLELARALCHDGGDDDGDRQRRERHAGHEAPDDERADRERGEDEIGGGRRRIGDGRDDRDGKREDRDRQRPGHDSKVLRGGRR